MYRWHHVLAIDEDVLALGRAQRHVQDRTVFGCIDAITPEHGIDPRAQPAGICKRQQQVQRFGVDALLGVIDVKPRRLDTQALSACRISGKQILQSVSLGALRMRRQCKPLRSLHQRNRGCRCSRGAHFSAFALSLIFCMSCFHDLTKASAPSCWSCSANASASMPAFRKGCSTSPTSPPSALSTLP